MMQAENIYPELPYKYPLCLNNKCSLARSCLRQLAEQSMPSNIEIGTFVTPKYLTAMGGPCPYYRPADKVRFGKGFIGLLENLPHQ